MEGTNEFQNTLEKLAGAVLQSEEGIFEAAHAMVNVARLSGVAKVFEAKPGIFGFSLGLIHGARVLSLLWRKFSPPRRHGV